MQYRAVQYSAVHCIAGQYSRVQYSTVQYSRVQYITVQYSGVQCTAVECSTIQCSRVQYIAVQHCLLRIISLGVGLPYKPVITSHTARGTGRHNGNGTPIMGDWTWGLGDWETGRRGTYLQILMILARQSGELESRYNDWTPALHCFSQEATRT